MNEDITVMGIDQSTDKIGVAIMKDYKLLHHETIHLSKLIKDNKDYLNKEYIDRICLFKGLMLDLVDEYDVQVVGFEIPMLKTFSGRVSKNLAGVYGKLCEALGVYKVALIELEMAYRVFQASEWRKGLKLGRKRDEMKENAIKLVNEKYGLDLMWVKAGSKKNEDDVAEAILIAEHLNGVVKGDRK